MAILKDKLDDSIIKAQKSNNEAAFEVADGFVPRLHIYISKDSNKKTFRVRYKANKTDKSYKLHTIGDYPDISLANARIEATTIIKNSGPLVPKEAPFLSFKEVAKQWMAHQKSYPMPNGKIRSVKTTDTFQEYLDARVLPYIGDIDINKVNRKVCKDLLVSIRDDVKDDKLPTEAGADKCRQILSSIIKFAVNEELKDELVNFEGTVALTAPAEFEMPKDILAEYNKCDDKKITVAPIWRICMKLQHHIFLRTSELISYVDEKEIPATKKGEKPTKIKTRHGARWNEIDFENKLWTVNKVRMKMKKTHTIPLSTQVIELLKELKTHTKESEFLFPNPENINLSQDSGTLAKKFTLFKIPYIPHDCRTIAGSWLKVQGFNPFAIEVQTYLKYLKGSMKINI
jgi:hypothetical protein